MRHLLNTLYVTSEDAYLSLEGENVLVKSHETIIARVPLHTLEGIVCFNYSGASTTLMGKCMELGMEMSFHLPNGQFLARLAGEERGNVLLRQAQYRLADDEKVGCALMKQCILGKAYNARWVLERAIRDHPDRVPVYKLKNASRSIAARLEDIETCTTLDELRGQEGEVAQRYFDCFDELILQQKYAFQFTTRTRRPPMDPVNSMLSFAYNLLMGNCAAALESVGLDPYVGFLHRAYPGRKSLACDLMEELRAVCADRYVLTCINKKIITEEHFQFLENGAVYLTNEGRRIFLRGWQKQKYDELTHPVLGEKIPWGLVPYVQAQYLARTIRGDRAAYPPFLWK